MKETLEFSVALRGRERSKEDRNHMVKKVMHYLAIGHIAHSKIGNSDIGGISGPYSKFKKSQPSNETRRHEPKLTKK